MRSWLLRTALCGAVAFSALSAGAQNRPPLTITWGEDDNYPHYGAAYVEGALGRWFPVTKAAQQSPFWKGDPHRLAVYNQFMNGTTPFEFTKNFKFTILNNENVWAKAMNRVLNEKVPVDKAVDELIARIKTVAGN